MDIQRPIRFLDRTSAPHLFTLIALASISALGSNIFLPSLPMMTEHFGTTPAIMGLSVGVFLAASAVMQLVSGPVSDAVGRRPVMFVALIVFSIASVACIYATNIVIFLILRAIQASAAVTLTLSRAIVRDVVGGERAASMIAYVTMGTSLVPMLSPALGGYLGQHFGWQSTFWLMGGLGAFLTLLCLLDQGETAPGAGSRLRDQMREYPVLLRSRRFWGYCLSAALGSGAFFAYLGGAPFVGTHVFGLDPQVLGIVFGAPAVGYLLGNFVSGRYSARVGIFTMTITGLFVTSSGSLLSLLVSMAGYGSALSFFGLMTLVGVGNGLTLPNATAGMMSVRPELAGSASGLGGAIMIGGGAILSAIAGFVLVMGETEFPLQLIMAVSAGAGVITLLLMIPRHARALA